MTSDRLILMLIIISLLALKHGMKGLPMHDYSPSR